MSKKLKIKFWKAEKALAMQILEQEGLPKEKGSGIVKITNFPAFYESAINLRGEDDRFYFNLDDIYFNSNSDRDTYLKKITQSITTELFTSNGELKVGEVCEVSNDNETWKVYPLITILREGLLRRYIVNVGYNVKAWDCFEHARPLAKRTEPKVETNGEIVTCTWEEE